MEDKTYGMGKDRFIIKNPTKIHTHDRICQMKAPKRKGCHSGYGKQNGTREARLPTKVLWMRRIRVLRASIDQRLRTQEKTLSDQFDTKRAKNRASREGKITTREERLALLLRLIRCLAVAVLKQPIRFCFQVHQVVAPDAYNMPTELLLKFNKKS
ncbi:Large ribosomal subunit protein eL19z-like protein [Drosera capensis]